MYTHNILPRQMNSYDGYDTSDDDDYDDDGEDMESDYETPELQRYRVSSVKMILDAHNERMNGAARNVASYRINEMPNTSPNSSAEPLETSIIDAMENTLLRCIRYVLLSIDPQQARSMAYYMLYVCHRVNVLTPLASALEQNVDVQRLLQNSKESKSLPAKKFWLWPFWKNPTSPMSSPVPEPLETSQGNDDTIEIGWAVRYMQREAKLPQEVYHRMRCMMHGEVPLNLFRVEVEYANQDLGVMGNATPESFPPTPLGRQHQTQRTAYYTCTVLDQATQALQHLQETGKTTT
jgi:hypothetical protein